MEKRTFTLSEINSAIKITAQRQGSRIPKERHSQAGLRHTLYVAKRRTKELSTDYWTARESLEPQRPTTYDREHTSAVFDELTEMTRENHRLTDSLGLTQQIIYDAEALLFSTLPITDHIDVSAHQSEKNDDERTPFPFRGHHLAFAWQITRGEAPVIIGASTRNIYRRRRLNADSYTDAALRSGRDVIGHTEQDGEDYKNALTTQLQVFKQLSDDYPIEILSGLPDRICSACKIGDHCKVKVSEVRQMSMIDHDREVMSAFVQEANSLGLGHQISVIQKQATFTDAEPEMVDCLRTTAGVLRSVLKFASVDWVELYNVFPMATHTQKAFSELNLTK